jgi:hypothetical protein
VGQGFFVQATDTTPQIQFPDRADAAHIVATIKLACACRVQFGGKALGRTTGGCPQLWQQFGALNTIQCLGRFDI